MSKSKKKKLSPKQVSESDYNLLGEGREELRHAMFDPGEMHLDLTKGEKLRTTALLMAINYVRETIVNDAEMYRALRQDHKELVPATVPWVLQCSIEFEDFLLGRYSRTNVGMVKRGMEAEQRAEQRRTSEAAGDKSQAEEQTNQPERSESVAAPVGE